MTSRWRLSAVAVNSCRALQSGVAPSLRAMQDLPTASCVSLSYQRSRATAGNKLSGIAVLTPAECGTPDGVLPLLSGGGGVGACED